MFNRLFAQLLNSIGIVFRTMRAFFMRQVTGFTAYVRRVTSFSRQAAKMVPKAMSTVAVAGKKPTKREDYIETRRLFVAKSLLVIIALVLVIAGLLAYFLLWPVLRSLFFTGYFYYKDEVVAAYNGKVVLYYDEAKAMPMFEGKLAEGIYEGRGVIYDEDGFAVYSGDFLNARYNGDGKLYESNVLVYEGQFVLGQYDGTGKLYSDGYLLYEGGFTKGLYQGRGALYDRDALVYDGMFADGLKTGQGAAYAEGRLLYEGGYKDDTYEGQGALYGDGGTVIYKGAFSGGQKNGLGIEYYPSGAVRYKGDFLAGLYDGQGIAYTESGAPAYEGGYREGLYQGEGKLWQDGGYLITAAFDRGEPQDGIRVSRGGKPYYEGASLGLVPHGEGTLYASTGEAVYRGPMRYGAIDGGALLGITANQARETFSDAALSEATSIRPGYYGFTIANNALGVTLYSTYATEYSEATIIGACLSTEGADAFFNKMPWADAAAYDAWSGKHGVELPLSVYGEARELNLGGAAPFAGEGYALAYEYPDYVFTVWSASEGGGLLLAEWTPAGTGSGQAIQVSALRAGVDTGDPALALLVSLGLADGNGAAGGAFSSDMYGIRDASRLFDSPDCTYIEAAAIMEQVLAYIESIEKHAAYDALAEVLRTQLDKARDDASMSKGDAEVMKALQYELEQTEIQLAKLSVGMGKALLMAEELTGLNIAGYDLPAALWTPDPQDIQPVTAAETLALMDTMMAYQELLQVKNDYVRALDALDAVSAEAAMGRAGEGSALEARKAVCTTRAELYTRLCAYSSSVLAYNTLSQGALARQTAWKFEAFGLEPPEEPPAEEPPAEGAQETGAPQQGASGAPDTATPTATPTPTPQPTPTPAGG